jgi:sugar (pentulose or hexulose) kinase
MAGTLKSYVIGLDIGTSSLKLVVFNLIDNKIQLELKKSTQEARISNNDNSSLHNEQHVGVILELIQMLFVELPSEYYERLQGIQICGQMHGIVLWNTETKQHSNLITWQGKCANEYPAFEMKPQRALFLDARCTPEFLSNLPVKSLSELNAGYGCATLFWLRKFGDLTLYNSAGTIQDYVTFL